MIRVTEPSWWTSESPALTRLSKLSLQSLYQAGHLFTPTGEGVTSELAGLFEQHGIQEVQTHSYALHYRAGIPEWQHFFDNVRISYRTGLPFLRKWIHMPDDYEELCQQMLYEMQQPDFIATWVLVTVWGRA